MPQGAIFKRKFSKILVFFSKMTYNEINKLGFVGEFEKLVYENEELPHRLRRSSLSKGASKLLQFEWQNFIIL